MKVKILKRLLSGYNDDDIVIIHKGNIYVTCRDDDYYKNILPCDISKLLKIVCKPLGLLLPCRDEDVIEINITKEEKEEFKMKAWEEQLHAEDGVDYMWFGVEAD